VIGCWLLVSGSVSASGLYLLPATSDLNPRKIICNELGLPSPVISRCPVEPEGSRQQQPTFTTVVLLVFGSPPTFGV